MVDIVKGALLALVICLILALILSILIKVIGFSEKVIYPLVQIIKLMAVSLGIIFGFREKSGGVLKGGATGLIFSLISILVFLVLGGSLKNNTFSIYDIASDVAIGAITGIVSVNIRSRKANK